MTKILLTDDMETLIKGIQRDKFSRRRVVLVKEWNEINDTGELYYPRHGNLISEAVTELHYLLLLLVQKW